ncbi:hypothetical protein ANCCEY_07879 [Ancylostoma ceylanicum]|uniref:Mediator of RNA polymerase II transcription subunit 13 n=1 Tax=Ancylostoma ceylanicum TaxID=53326 RepID=A0A0D6LLP7_9BILA|nr:hypothetical protein ANCCEY_07879 [Ancylostoma ceylanicum]
MAGNGGSLEDCFSNVYALTELNGLKWRCFLTPSNSPRGIPVQSDPILKAYGNCLRDGLICTWRRKPLELKPNEPLPLPSFTNEISKELWLFWYSNEPPEKLSINTSHLGEFYLLTHDNNHSIFLNFAVMQSLARSHYLISKRLSLRPRFAMKIC